MIAHVVMFRPREDLAASDRAALIAALERAVREIPTLRGVRYGKRVRFGAGYELAAPDVADVLAMIEFDDLAGLQAYLTHPSHEELEARFTASLAAGFVYDFEFVDLGDL